MDTKLSDVRKVLHALDAPWKKISARKGRGSASHWIEIIITLDHKKQFVDEDEIRLGDALKKFACQAVENFCEDYKMEDGYRGKRVHAQIKWNKI